MSKDPVNTASVTILGRDYRINTPASEREALFHSAHYLDQKMREIRAGGKAIGVERIAVMAALNIAYELMQCRDQNEKQTLEAEEKIQSLLQKLDAVIPAAKL